MILGGHETGFRVNIAPNDYTSIYSKATMPGIHTRKGMPMDGAQKSRGNVRRRTAVNQEIPMANPSLH